MMRSRNPQLTLTSPDHLPHLCEPERSPPSLNQPFNQNPTASTTKATKLRDPEALVSQSVIRTMRQEDRSRRACGHTREPTIVRQHPCYRLGFPRQFGISDQLESRLGFGPAVTHPSEPVCSQDGTGLCLFFIVLEASAESLLVHRAGSAYTYGVFE